VKTRIGPSLGSRYSVTMGSNEDCNIEQVFAENSRVENPILQRSACSISRRNATFPAPPTSMKCLVNNFSKLCMSLHDKMAKGNLQQVSKLDDYERDQ